MLRLSAVAVVLAVCVGVSSAVPQLMGVEGLLLKEAVKKVQKKFNTVQTPLVSTQLQTTATETDLYKDFYKKTQVDVRHVVSSTHYDTVEYSSVEMQEPDETITVEYATVALVPTATTSTTPVRTERVTLGYEEFDWPTETQTYTVAANASVTRVVENDLGLM